MSPLFKNELTDLPMVYLFQISVRSQLIYSITLLSVVLLASVLPFVKVTLSIKSQGSMQTGFEKSRLLAPADGRITAIHIEENRKFKKGSLLIAIDPYLPSQELKFNEYHIDRLSRLRNDAKTLLQLQGSHKVHTPVYRRNLEQYYKQMQMVDSELERTKSIYDRYFTLFQKSVVTAAEFEQLKFNYNKAVQDRELTIANFKQQWQTEVTQYETELAALLKDKRVLESQQQTYQLKATADGYAFQTSGIQIGDHVYANQQLAELTVDKKVFAYCYVKPSQITYIKKGQTVHLQVDSFSFQDWGVLVAEVIDIAVDVILVNNEPYFKVKCQLSKNHLKLRNGTIGKLKTGMTFSARFIMGARSLYHLVSDKAENWLIS